MLCRTKRKIERYKHKEQDPVGGNKPRATDGVSFTSKSCETKVKNLKRNVACIDHDKVSRNDPKKCNFYGKLHKLFSRDSAIQPKTLCSNLDGPVKQSKEAVKNAENSSSRGSDAEEHPVVTSKKKKLPERKNRVEGLVGLFKEFTQDRKEEEKEKLENSKVCTMTHDSNELLF